MRMQLKEIYFAFDGKLIGTPKLKHSVCEAVSRLPKEIVDQITNSCWFIGSTDDSWAYAFDANELKNQHLIYLSDNLFRQSQIQIIFTIIHEICHVLLGHKNSISRIQTKGEVKQQEKAADMLANILLRE